MVGDIGTIVMIDTDSEGYVIEFFSASGFCNCNGVSGTWHDPSFKKFGHFACASAVIFYFLFIKNSYNSTHPLGFNSVPVSLSEYAEVK